jgi:CheY-like chemotaxis protein
VTLALKDHYRFIIVDINLPGMDGFEVTERIRNSAAAGAVPIIAITSLAMLGGRERILAAGCNGYFEKPIDPLTIMEKIQAILERRG